MVGSGSGQSQPGFRAFNLENYGSKLSAESGSKLSAESGSKLSAESGSKLSAESGSELPTESGSATLPSRPEPRFTQPHKSQNWPLMQPQALIYSLKIY